MPLLLLLLWLAALIVSLYFADTVMTHIVDVPALYASIACFANLAGVSGAVPLPWLENALSALSHMTVVAFFLPVFLFVLLPWFGKPERADEIDENIAAAFGIAENVYYQSPFVFSCAPINGSRVGALDYAFYSRFKTVADWENPAIGEKLCAALDCASVEAFRYGEKGVFRKRPDRRVVMLTVIPDDNAQDGNIPADPLFKRD